MKFKKIFSWFDFFYLTQLVARNYFSNIVLWLTNFGVPVLIFFILHNILGEENKSIGMSIGVASSGVISIGVLSLPVALTEWKKSVIYKKIKISLLSGTQFFLSFFIFYFLISNLVFWITLTATIVIDKNTLNEIKKITQWELLIGGLMELIFISLNIGVLISLTVNNVMGANGIGFGIYLIAAFLSNCFIPMDIGFKSGFLQKWGWWNPFFSSCQILYAAFLENLTLENIEDPVKKAIPLLKIEQLKLWVTDIKGNGKYINLGYFTNLWSNSLFALTWIGGIFSLNVFLLKFKKDF